MLFGARLKVVKSTKVVTIALEEIARTKLVDIVNKRRSIKVKILNALKE